MKSLRGRVGSENRYAASHYGEMWTENYPERAGSDEMSQVLRREHC